MGYPQCLHVNSATRVSLSLRSRLRSERAARIASTPIGRANTPPISISIHAHVGRLDHAAACAANSTSTAATVTGRGAPLPTRATPLPVRAIEPRHHPMTTPFKISDRALPCIAAALQDLSCYSGPMYCFTASETIGRSGIVTVHRRPLRGKPSPHGSPLRPSAPSPSSGGRGALSRGGSVMSGKKPRRKWTATQTLRSVLETLRSEGKVAQHRVPRPASAGQSVPPASAGGKRQLPSFPLYNSLAAGFSRLPLDPRSSPEDSDLPPFLHVRDVIARSVPVPAS